MYYRNFAKLFDTPHGQLLVTRNDHAEGRCLIVLTFHRPDCGLATDTRQFAISEHLRAEDTWEAIDERHATEWAARLLGV